MKKCFQCNKSGPTPFHITEINKDKTVYSYDLCKKCGEKIHPMGNKIDLSHIKTPQELIDFISGAETKKDKPVADPCPKCGLTNEDFDVKGRFGCDKCYEHFSDIMKELVYPYHKANSHVGKTPKNYFKKLCESNVDEKRKLLKLQLAKAIELEEYEKAAKIKIELQSLSQNPPSSCEDQ